MLAHELDTLFAVARARAEQQPDQTAYIFLADGETEEEWLTYAELDRRARAIAAQLDEANATGERALLLYPPGLDYIAAFFGCLYAGVIAVPAYPPRRNRSVGRLQSIVADSGAAIALTTQSIREMVERQFTPAAELAGLNWLATDSGDASRADAWVERQISPAAIAFLQYTSGSTASPKGVMVSHANLMHNSALLYKAYGHSDASQGVIWLPPYHDMGLIGGILQPCYGGFPVTLMSPFAFLQHPARWLKAVTRYRATTTGGPNFAYDLCADKITPEQRAELDLSSIEIAFNGAEVVRSETLERFSEAFAPCGFDPRAFYPCYGLAEGTLYVTGAIKGEGALTLSVDASELERHRVLVRDKAGEGVRTLVSSGRSSDDQHVVIVDQATGEPCAPDQVGEIWAAGPSIAGGYYGREQDTMDAFGGRLPESERGPYLRTGDLGFMRDGELYVTGRLKDLIIIAGRNHYPQDIERTVESASPVLRPGAGAAFAVDVADEERLVIVQEVERRPKGGMSTDDVILRIRELVTTEHELDVYAIALIRIGTIPKTSSGKIQRRACRAAFLDGSLDAVATWQHEVGQHEPVPEAAAGGPTTPAATGADAVRIQNWLLEQLAQRLRTDVATLDPTKPFAHLGLDSREAVILSGDLEDWLDRRLSPTLVYDYPTPAALARHLAGEDAVAQPVAAGPQLSGREPIAVIGLACRMPGAKGTDAYWAMLRGGVDAITEVPAGRWDAQSLFDPEPGTPGKMRTVWGGFVDGVDGFDADFFGITPREAERMDPQQRLLLEVTWEALEQAGMDPAALAGSDTGVFIGISSSDYSHYQLDTLNTIDAYAATGNAHSVAANRLSYLLDLQGPSMAIDTACSSSLVALHTACQSLRTGESDLALAGGVNLILTPQLTIAFSHALMMAGDGRCKTFDAAADGYVRGEGCGVAVLKRLEDAQRDGDPIWAVVRGSAVNQDGRTNGLTAPSGLAQQKVIARALRNAGVAAADIGYVEAHGTGTILGDPIEVEALQAVIGGRPVDRRCAIGSVKTNIGHLEAAAGIAGFIKAVLACSNGEIPPNLHFKEANPHIRLEGSGFFVPTEATPWPFDGPRLAGVSSFGFGGTNAHVIVESPPCGREPTNEIERPLHLLALSAHSKEALAELAGRYRDAFAVGSAQAADLCHTANTGRAQFAHRLALRGAKVEELLAGLDAHCNRQRRVGSHAGVASRREPPRVAFLFTGQGSQYAHMGRVLYDTQPVFRGALDRCTAALDGHLSRPLLEVLFADNDADAGLIDETAYTQPALFAIEYALAELWRSWGVEPVAVLGHSVGEYAAACVAGVFSLEDGIRLIAERAARMQALPAGGAMAAVLAAPDALQSVLAEIDGVEAAALNGPSNTVVSGTAEAVDALAERFIAQGERVQRLTVSHAFHSHLMDPMLDGFEAFASGIDYARPQITLVSNLTGAVLEPGRVPDAAYWRQHVRQPVRFADGIGALAELNVDIMLEIGPHPVLVGMGKRVDRRRDVQWLASVRKDHPAWEPMLDALSALWVVGYPVDWHGFDAPYQRKRLAMPTYPFEDRSYWFGGSGFALGEGVPAAGESAAPAGMATSEGEAIPAEPRPELPDKDGLIALDEAARAAVLIDYLRHEAADIMKTSVAKVEPEVSLDQTGFDSIMLVDLQRRVRKAVGVDIPFEPLLANPTIGNAGRLLSQALSAEAAKGTGEEGASA